jgi:hypothetical protein
MALLLAPYNNSMRLGMGFNSYTQTLCIDNAVEIRNKQVVRNDNPSQVSRIASFALLQTLRSWQPPY